MNGHLFASHGNNDPVLEGATINVSMEPQLFSTAQFLSFVSSLLGWNLFSLFFLNFAPKFLFKENSSKSTGFESALISFVFHFVNDLKIVNIIFQYNIWMLMSYKVFLKVFIYYLYFITLYITLNIFVYNI